MGLQERNYGLWGGNEDAFLGLGKKAKERRAAKKEKVAIRFERRRLKNDERRANTERVRAGTEIMKSSLGTGGSKNTAPAPPAKQDNGQGGQGQGTGQTGMPGATSGLAPVQAGIGGNTMIVVLGVLLIGGYLFVNKKKTN